MKYLSLLLLAGMVGCSKPETSYVCGLNWHSKNPVTGNLLMATVWEVAGTGTGQLRNDKLPARHIDAIKSRYPGLIDATIDLTSPLITNNWQDYMVPEFKSGSILYVPWPKLPIPSALRRNK